MIHLPVYNTEGQEVDTLLVDEAVFGGHVRYPLLKQAIVMYHANRRVGTAATRCRSMVAGSTRKIYRQKGSGFARMGTVRTNIRRGGGVAFAKVARDFSRRMPRKQKRLARDSAILAKLLSNDVLVVDELNFEKPRTKDFVAVLGNLKIDRSCLVAVSDYNDSLCRSLRNVPGLDMIKASDLNAGGICDHHKMLFTKNAFMTLMDREKDEHREVKSRQQS